MLKKLLNKLHGPVYASCVAELVLQTMDPLQSGGWVLDTKYSFGALERMLLDSPNRILELGTWAENESATEPNDRNRCARWPNNAVQRWRTPCRTDR